MLQNYFAFLIFCGDYVNQCETELRINDLFKPKHASFFKDLHFFDNYIEVVLTT